MIKKIYKYPTGGEVPKGAVYLNTITQTELLGPTGKGDLELKTKCWLVWHYFLVEVEE